MPLHPDIIEQMAPPPPLAASPTASSDKEQSKHSHHHFDRNIFERKMRNFEQSVGTKQGSNSSLFGKSDSHLIYNHSKSNDVDDDINSLAESIDSDSGRNHYNSARIISQHELMSKSTSALFDDSHARSGMSLEKLLLSPKKKGSKSQKKETSKRNSEPKRKSMLSRFLGGGMKQRHSQPTSEPTKSDFAEMDDILKYSDIMSVGGDTSTPSISEKKTLDLRSLSLKSPPMLDRFSASATSLTSDSKSTSRSPSNIVDLDSWNKKQKMKQSKSKSKSPRRQTTAEMPLPRRGRERSQDRAPRAPERVGTPTLNRSRSLSHIDQLSWADHSNLLAQPSPQQKKNKFFASPTKILKSFPKIKPSPREVPRPRMPNKMGQFSTSFKVRSKASQATQQQQPVERNSLLPVRNKKIRSKSLDRAGLPTTNVSGGRTPKGGTKKRLSSASSIGSRAASVPSSICISMTASDKLDQALQKLRENEAPSKRRSSRRDSRDGSYKGHERRGSRNSPSAGSRLHDSCRSLQLETPTKSASRRSLKATRQLSLRNIKYPEVEPVTHEHRRSPRPGRRKTSPKRPDYARSQSLQNVQASPSPRRTMSSGSRKKGSLSSSSHRAVDERQMTTYAPRDVVKYDERKKSDRLARGDKLPRRGDSRRRLGVGAEASPRRRRSRSSSAKGIQPLATPVY